MSPQSRPISLPPLALIDLVAAHEKHGLCRGLEEIDDVFVEEANAERAMVTIERFDFFVSSRAPQLLNLGLLRAEIDMYDVSAFTLADPSFLKDVRRVTQ